MSNYGKDSSALTHSGEKTIFQNISKNLKPEYCPQCTSAAPPSEAVVSMTKKLLLKKNKSLKILLEEVVMVGGEGGVVQVEARPAGQKTRKPHRRHRHCTLQCTMQKTMHNT